MNSLKTELQRLGFMTQQNRLKAQLIMLGYKRSTDKNYVHKTEVLEFNDMFITIYSSVVEFDFKNQYRGIQSFELKTVLKTTKDMRDQSNDKT